MEKYIVPIGQTQSEFTAKNVIAVLDPPASFGVRDVYGEIERAMREPIGSESLTTIAAGKKTAAIVVNDITRPYPGKEMVKVITDVLLSAGLKAENISLVIAYGHHRDNTPGELEQMLGEDICARFKIVHHHAAEPDTLAFLGKTSMGVPVEINRVFAQADVKITTGCITPHQLAGFSGGRKSILPGISGMSALRIHHSFPIRPEQTSLGWLHGNPFHEQALEAARIAGVNFIVNSVDNAQRQVVQCVAGDVEKAYLKGVALCTEVWSVKVPRKADIVIASPGGYPRDFDLHQSQKALGCAEMLCKKGGRIILCAEMQDGAGRPGKILLDADSPAQVTAEFRKTGYTPEALSKAYMLARALSCYSISVAESRIPPEQLRRMFFDAYPSVQAALNDSYKQCGESASVLIAPYASDILPVIEQ